MYGEPDTRSVKQIDAKVATLPASTIAATHRELQTFIHEGELETTVRNTHVTRLSLFAACLVFAASHASAQQELSDVSPYNKLSDVLRRTKWDGIIGTWVDAESKGAAAKATYDWKIKDRAIEITTVRGEHQDVALMGVNGKTGGVFHMGADSDGGSSIGKWIVQDNGDVVLGLVYTSSTGQEGEVIIRHHLVDKNTMIVTIEAPQPMRFKMIRTKPKDGADENP